MSPSEKQHFSLTAHAGWKIHCLLSGQENWKCILAESMPSSMAALGSSQQQGKYYLMSTHICTFLSWWGEKPITSFRPAALFYVRNTKC